MSEEGNLQEVQREDDPTLRTILVSEARTEDLDSIIKIWQQSLSALAPAYGADITAQDFPKLAEGVS